MLLPLPFMNKIKIVDISTLIPGPMATSLLANQIGAQVVKIEDINQPDPMINMRPSKEGVGLGYQELIKNKKVLKIDFRSQLEKIKDELKDAQVFIHNFKANRVFKMGLAFEGVVKINPKIIYVSVAGYPESSVMAGKGAHDLNILALSGFLDNQSKLGEPLPLPSLLLADIFSSYHIVTKLMAALLKAETGIHLQISMLEAMQEAMLIGKFFDAQSYPMSGRLPCYCVYKGKDGLVAVAALENSLWIDFCHHLNREDLIAKQFEISAVPEIAKELSKYEIKHWLDKSLDFCVTPVLSKI